MLTKAYLLAGIAAGVVRTQATDYWFIPEGLTNTFCDGHSIPNWDDCESEYIDWFLSTEMRIGPGILEGQTLTTGDCQLRYVKCKTDDYEWVQEDEMGLFSILRRTCEGIGGGGVRRQGDLCVIAESPRNPFGGDPRMKRSLGQAREAKQAAKRAEPLRSHARELVSPNTKPLERRQSCENGGPCYGYTETTFAGNIPGIRQDVCGNTFQHGQSCELTTSVTVTDTYTAGIDISAGLKDAIGIGASFSVSHSEAWTGSISVNVPIDCPEGARRGRVFWYPYMEVSQGECTEGTCNNGLCTDIQRHTCTTRKAVGDDTGFAAGGFEVQCL